MKNAKELNQITNAIIERRIQEAKEQTLNYLKTRIYPQMEKAAAAGDWKVTYQVDRWVYIDIIIEELEKLEYHVNKQDNILRISWREE